MDTTSVSANASYDANTNTETITETTIEQFNQGTTDFAIVTTVNSARIDAEGNVSYSKETTAFTMAGIKTVKSENLSKVDFSDRVSEIVQKSADLKKSIGLGFCQTLAGELNKVQANQDAKEYWFNVATLAAFLPNFSSTALSIISSINLGNSGYNIYKSLKNKNIDVNGNIYQKIYSKKK
jgi:hypothetical protein